MSSASPARPLAAPAPGHRRARPASGRPASRRPTRRYSGPSAGVVRGAAVAAPGIALPTRRPPAPRQAPRKRRQRSLALGGLPSAALVSPRRLLALSLRGRLWIGVVAFGLIGLITAQLLVLRLNTSIGQSLTRVSALSRENAAMAITNSEAGSGEQIETRARQQGMVSLSPGELSFRRAAARGAAQAAAQELRSWKASSSSEGLLSGGHGASSSSDSASTSTGEAAVSEALSGSQATTSSEQVAAAAPSSQEAAGTTEQTTAPSTSATQPTQTLAPAPESQAGAAQAPAGAGG
jgi:hypothetical protein